MAGGGSSDGLCVVVVVGRAAAGYIQVQGACAVKPHLVVVEGGGRQQGTYRSREHAPSSLTLWWWRGEGGSRVHTGPGSMRRQASPRLVGAYPAVTRITEAECNFRDNTHPHRLRTQKRAAVPACGQEDLSPSVVGTPGRQVDRLLVGGQSLVIGNPDALQHTAASTSVKFK